MCSKTAQEIINISIYVHKAYSTDGLGSSFQVPSMFPAFITMATPLRVNFSGSSDVFSGIVKQHVCRD